MQVERNKGHNKDRRNKDNNKGLLRVKADNQEVGLVIYAITESSNGVKDRIALSKGRNIFGLRYFSSKSKGRLVQNIHVGLKSHGDG